MPIRVLDTSVAAKIAAGEVVERPASVVKELIENSIDAGATQVKVETRGGGVELIRVVDNGWGIPSEELALAFQRHSTSKIERVEDLTAVRTLGFRGEALPSIAAVSQVIMVSRPAGELAGSYIEIAGGEVLQEGTRGAPLGTTVTVRDLFYNVPARRKFLRSEDTEAAHIYHLLCQYALAYPGLRFTLVSSGRMAFQSTGSGQLLDVLGQVYGLEVAKSMLEVGGGAAGTADRGTSVTIRGYVSQPAVHRATRGHLSFFVNHRWVQSRMLAFAVEEAYRTTLPSGRHPLCALNILVPPEELDVNVHPTKSEVRFRWDRQVFAEVQKAVRGCLVAGAPIPLVTAPAAWPAERGRPLPVPLKRVLVAGTVQVLGPEPVSSDIMAPGKVTSKLPPLRVLGQVAQTYIIAEAPEGMYLIDQHTAHERVLYERIRGEQARAGVSSQLLLEPVTLELNPHQAPALSAHLDELSRLGFSIEPFGDRVYLLRAVPVVLFKGDFKLALGELLDQLSQGQGSPEDWLDKAAITMACHGAVKAGQALTAVEMRELVEQLEKTDSPRTCAHGRPTMLHLSAEQLEKEFGRR
ncbi:MAG: DNA mismatch repair endonuclease MutL [Chloroflexota bacterium]